MSTETVTTVPSVPRVPRLLLNGKIPIRAQLTRLGWKVVFHTSTGGWSPLNDAIFMNHQQAIAACADIVNQNPEKYHDDN